MDFAPGRFRARLRSGSVMKLGTISSQPPRHRPEEILSDRPPTRGSSSGSSASAPPSFVVTLAKRYPELALGGVAGVLILSTVGAAGLARGAKRIALRFAHRRRRGPAHRRRPGRCPLVVPGLVVAAVIVAVHVLDRVEPPKPSWAAAQQSAVGPSSWFPRARAGLASVQSYTQLPFRFRYRTRPETWYLRRGSPPGYGCGYGKLKTNRCGHGSLLRPALASPPVVLAAVGVGAQAVGCACKHCIP